MARPLDLAFDVVGEGPPVVLLHGLYGCGASWREVMAQLAGSHRVYAVDLRNHGASPASPDMSYLAMADDVLALIEREGLEQPALVGHSVGGKVAMTLALTAPYAAGALAVIEAAPITPLRPWIEQLRAATAAQGRMRAAQRRGGWAGLLAQPAEPGLDPRCNLPAIALSLYELCRFPPHLRHLSSPLALHVVAGGASEFVQPVDARAFQSMFPRAQLEVIAGAGHWLHVERPHALLECLRPCLAAAGRLPARGAAI